MFFNFTETEPLTRYKLISQSIVPRPIAWIVTESETLNIAPFSFFSGVSSHPPTVMVAIGHKKDGTPKDTLHNIRTTKKCVICSVATDRMEKMHFSSAELDADIDEAEKFNIPTKRVIEGYPPMIKGVHGNMILLLQQMAVGTLSSPGKMVEIPPLAVIFILSCPVGRLLIELPIPSPPGTLTSHIPQAQKHSKNCLTNTHFLFSVAQHSTKEGGNEQLW